MNHSHRVLAGLLAVLLSLLLSPGLHAQPAAEAPAPSSAELPGSLRGARIARVLPADPAARAKAPLTMLTGNLTDEQVAELAAVAPNVRIIRAADRAAAMEHAATADGIDGRFATADFLAKAPKLSWVHSPSAGVERLLAIADIGDRRELVITNARGVHGPAIADHAMAMLLSLTRQLPHYHALQNKGEWSREDPAQRPIALAGRTMLVVGFGGIGTEIGQRAHGFGMKVIATRRSDTAAPEFVQKVGRPGDLAAMLPEADVIAICVPLTPETENLFDEKMFRAVKPGAYLINIARGNFVNTDAMIVALKDGRLAGAALDVTEPEPLPAGHALWKAPNVLITPHVASDGELTDERWWALYKENIRRFGAGEPLLNCVDVQAGY